MDFIFRFLRWKVASAVWNAGARAIHRRQAPLTPERQQFASNTGAMLLTFLILAVFVVALAAFG